MPLCDTPDDIISLCYLSKISVHSVCLIKQGKAQSQLPDLLSELVLPHALYSAKKALPPSVQNAIRDNLHLVRVHVHSKRFIEEVNT